VPESDGITYILKKNPARLKEKLLAGVKDKTAIVCLMMYAGDD